MCSLYIKMRWEIISGELLKTIEANEIFGFLRRTE
jgi:hypothetical protein